MSTILSILKFMAFMSIAAIVTEIIIVIGIMIYDYIEEKFHYKK